MSYTDEEKKESVQGLVQGTLSFPTDKLGNRNVVVSFNEIMELIRSIFVYDSDAIYYVIKLVSDDLGFLIRNELRTIDKLLDSVDDLSMPSKPINDVTSLADAKSALNEIDGALQRNGVIGVGESAKYNAFMDTIKNDLGRTTKMTYIPRGSSQAIKDIVRAASEAIVESRTNFTSLLEEHSSTIARVEQLLVSFDEFMAENIAGMVGSRQVARASSELQTLHTELDSMEPEERTSIARQSLLRVLANQAVIKGLVNRLLPGESKIAQLSYGTVTYRVSAYGEGTAPYIEGTECAPWKIRNSNNDVFGATINGTSITVDLLSEGAAQAELTGTNDGDFAIASSLSVPYPFQSTIGPFDIVAPANLFHIWVNGTHYEKRTITGVGITAASLAADLSSAADWVPSKPSLVFSDVSSCLKIVYGTGPGSPVLYSNRSMRIGQGVDDLGVLRSWYVATPTLELSDSSSGWDGNDELKVQANDATTSTTVSLPTGSWPDYSVTAASVASAISGSGFIGDVSGDKVVVRSTEYGEGSIVTIRSSGTGTDSHRGAITLGFTQDQEVRESDITGQTVVDALNNDATFRAEATASLVKRFLLTNSYATGSGSDIVISADEDPTAQWPSAASIKVSVSYGVGDVVGIYQLTGYSHSAGNLTLALDRNMRAAGTNMIVSVYSDVLKVKSTDTTTSGTVSITDPANSARTILGLASGSLESTVGKLLFEFNDLVLGWKALDLQPFRLKVGDKLINSAGTELTELAALGEIADGIVSIAPEVDASFALSSAGFFVESAAKMAYETFILDVQSWLSNAVFKDGLDRIDTMLAPLFLKQPTKNSVDRVYIEVSSLKTEIENLEQVCSDFLVNKLAGVDRALKLMNERGHNRARDLLLEGKISEFFSLTPQNSSYSGDFLTKAAEVVVEDLNESKTAKAKYDADIIRYAGSSLDDVDPNYNFLDIEEDLPEVLMEESWAGIDEDVG
ncbi:MAG: hypothetical protein ACXAEU_19850 [Candidatus Hodarchaeales archaeon]|jgi:hypothetical protein